MNNLQIISYKLQFSKKGFTLVELLVVMAIIGILASVGVASYSQSRAAARDAKRISDISKLQIAIEQYYNANGGYPPYPTINPLVGTNIHYAVGDADFKNSLVPTYLDTIPRDPNVSIDTDANNYKYAFDYPSVGVFKYVLWTKFETQSTSLNREDEIDEGQYIPPTSPGGWPGCDDVGKNYCVGVR